MFGKKQPVFTGAVQIPTGGVFNDKTNFVDLHQDFPVQFDKYVMGHTPFLVASSRIGIEAMQLHGSRLAQLDSQHDQHRDFHNLLRLYAKQRLTPFKLNITRVFGIGVKSDLPQDINASLYRLIAKVMLPFAFPGQNEQVVDSYNHIILELSKDKDSKDKLCAFVKAMTDSGFLKKLQLDCLEIYPKILSAEKPLRPAFFLDLTKITRNHPLRCECPSTSSRSTKIYTKTLRKSLPDK